jgi:D-lactate dehydrogenase
MSIDYDSVIQSAKNIVGSENVLTAKSDCWAYGYDNSRRHAPPDLVVFAEHRDAIQQLVSLCNTHQLPLITRGRGTGTTGATVPHTGGMVLSLERMNHIINVDPANRAITVQPGVTNQQVQQESAKHGFFWPPDPTSAAFCTVGGNLAYNSAGPRAVKYGTPRENVLRLEAVTGHADIIHTGSYTTKGVVGYDLTRLLIGSEGTLAIITEATLKLTPLAESKRTLQAVYRDIQSAAAAVTAIMAQPVTPCALEFIDANAINMVRAYSSVELPTDAGAMLMIEVDGSDSAMQQAVTSISEAAHNSGLTQFRSAETDAEVAALWETRKALSPALRNVAPKKINEDVVVPVSNMPDLITGLDKLARQYDIKIVNFGHAGNGNIHVNLLVNPDDAQEMQRAHACLSDTFDLVLSLNGSISGEHGIGLEKRDFVAREIDPATLSLMHAIKQQFDPLGILNPGKALPEITR